MSETHGATRYRQATDGNGPPKAASEAVSSTQLRPVNRVSFIDARTTRLPTGEHSIIDDFEPRDHRDPSHAISRWMAYFNLIRVGFGPGMLGMPLAISQHGLITGPLISILIGILLTYSQLKLLWCLNEISRRLHIPYISYRYGFRMALLHGPPILHPLGHCGPTIIALSMILSQIGICTVIVIFTSDNLRDIMDWETARTAMYVLLIPFLAMEFGLRTLKLISYASMFGNFVNAASMSLVVYLFLVDPRGKTVLANKGTVNYLFGIGSMLFASSVVGVVVSMDKALKNPRDMVSRYGILRVGMGIITTFATVFGTLGYIAYGTMEENVMRSLPYDDDVSMASMGLYMISVMFAYPIQCYPATQILLETIKNHDPNHTPLDTTMRIIEYVSRPIFVCITFLIGYLLPFQAPFVAFVGNLCTIPLAIVYPAMMELSLKYPRHFGRYSFHLIKCLCIIIGGIITWIIGVALCGYILYIRVLSLQSPNNTAFL